MLRAARSAVVRVLMVCFSPNPAFKTPTIGSLACAVCRSCCYAEGQMRTIVNTCSAQGRLLITLKPVVPQGASSHRIWTSQVVYYVIDAAALRTTRSIAFHGCPDCNDWLLYRQAVARQNFFDSSFLSREQPRPPSLAFIAAQVQFLTMLRGCLY